MTPKSVTKTTGQTAGQTSAIAAASIVDESGNLTEVGISQFFGFTTSSFCDAVYQSVDDYLADGLDAMEVALLPSFVDDESRSALKNMNDQFMDFLNNAFDKNLDKFEIYIKRNIFTMPPNVAPVSK